MAYGYDAIGAGRADISMVHGRWGYPNAHAHLQTHACRRWLCPATFFSWSNVVRSRVSRSWNFNGTAGVWRRSAVAAVGIWEHDTIGGGRRPCPTSALLRPFAMSLCGSGRPLWSCPPRLPRTGHSRRGGSRALASRLPRRRPTRSRRPTRPWCTRWCSFSTPSPASATPTRSCSSSTFGRQCLSVSPFRGRGWG